jgi:uncharacterized phiE125 gp8 family phage protein
MLPLTEVKTHLRVTHDHEDALIERMVAAARAYLENRNGSYYGEPTTVVEWLEGFGDRSLWLRNAPTGAVTITSEGETIDAADYEVRGRQIVRKRGAWWSGVPYAVEYEAGYEEGQGPEDVIADVLNLAGALYRNRETVVTGTVVATVDLLTTRKVRL